MVILQRTSLWGLYINFQTNLLIEAAGNGVLIFLSPLLQIQQHMWNYDPWRNIQVRLFHRQFLY